MLDFNKYKMKRYLHFDHRVKIKHVKNYITNNNRIAVHSFLPLIHYTIATEKFTGIKNPELQNRPVKPKYRKIMYAGHLDNYIYKYYAEEKLNPKYNKWCEDNVIDECSIAYRNNKHGQSNIDYAANIINDIVQFNEAYILVGDFSEFFDKTNHTLLKKRLLTVLNEKCLSNDWYNVYKSITKYGYYEKSLLIKNFGTDKQLKSARKNTYFNQLKDFRKFQKLHPTKKNKSSIGIPQGTAISAVFANVYAIDFDVSMNKIAKRYSGVYRRYSDDFILVIPTEQCTGMISINQFQQIQQDVLDLAKINQIEIQKEKTTPYIYSHNKIIDTCNNTFTKMDYLGFVFDGETVSMRGKSPYKFYRQAYKLIYRAQKVKREKKLHKLPYRKQIYSLYTDLGLNEGKYGNFITYAKKAQSKFDQLSPNTTNLMLEQIKNRKKRIEKRLGIKIHSRI